MGVWAQEKNGRLPAPPGSSPIGAKTESLGEAEANHEKFVCITIDPADVE